MASVGINSITYNDIGGQLAAPIAGTFLAFPPLAAGPIDYGPEYNIVQIPVVGSNTTLSKNLGFLGRDLTIPLIHLGADLSAAYTFKKGLTDAYAATRFNITWTNGATFYACVLKRNGAVDEKVFALDGLTALVTTYHFRQLSLT